MSEKICEYCGVYEQDHSYEHLARECYPKQIEILEEKLKKATAHQSGAAIVRRGQDGESGEFFWRKASNPPKTDETVWVYYDGEQNYGYYSDGWFLNQDGEIDVNVTHWMPLPNPPKCEGAPCTCDIEQPDIEKLKEDECSERPVHALVIPPIDDKMFNNFEDMLYAFEDIHNQRLWDRQEAAFEWALDFLKVNRDKLSKAV